VTAEEEEEQKDGEKEERKARGTKAAYILLGGGVDFTLIQNALNKIYRLRQFVNTTEFMKRQRDMPIPRE